MPESEPVTDQGWSNREVLAAIVQSSDDAIIAEAADGTITSWNPAAERLYGYAAGEAIGRPISMLEPAQCAGETRETLRRVLAGERVDHRETQRLARDGRLLDVSVTVSPIHGPDGRVVGASTIARDIGERRRVAQYREALLAVTRVLAGSDAVEEAAPGMLEGLGTSMGWDLGALWLVDERGEALELAFRWRSPDLSPAQAPAASETTRFAPGEGLPGGAWARGEPVWVQDVSADEEFPRSEVVAGEDVRGAIALSVWSGPRTLGVLEFFSRDLRPPDRALSELLHAVGGQVGAFVERARAGEALRAARADAERANRAKSEFLSRMSHELRTPLNAVLGFAQLLELEALGQRQHESVEQILKAGRHLVALVDEVLDLARIEAGQLRLSLEPVAVGDVIEESLALMAPVAERGGIDVRADLAGAGSWSVLADRQRLKQVLLNLLSNAIKYNRQGGSVLVGLEPVGGKRLAISVSDTGPGIRPEQLARLFEPFDRLDAESGGTEGTGLGLALSRQLVELMGGRLEVTSEPGAGTTMSVELARAEAHQAGGGGHEAAGEGAREGELAGQTLLYIEDNLANLRLIERLIERFPDVRLLPAMQGELGIELAREHRPDAILLDLHLPDLHGHEVLLRLRAEPALRDTPVVIVSADATERQRTRMLEAGAYAYLAKPLDVREFLAVLDACLSAAGEERAQPRRT